MDNEIRRNPETGSIEERVESWVEVNVEEVNATVERLTTEIEATRGELEGSRNRTIELEAQLSSKESELESAKSRQDRLTGLVSEGQAVDDSGSDVSDDSVEGQTEGGEAVAVDVIATTDNF